MKKFYPFAISSLLILSACSKERITGSGPIVTEKRSFDYFTIVQVSGSTDVIINQSPTFSVEVRGYANLLPYFETKVVNKALELHYKNNSNISNDNVQVIVNMPVLTAVGTNGSADIQATGNFTGSGGLTATVTGSGNIFIERGVVDYLYTSIAGSGNIQAFGLLAKNAEAHTSGSGNVELSSSQELYVRIAGSGNVYYRGNPTVNANISGTGSVIRR